MTPTHAVHPIVFGRTDVGIKLTNRVFTTFQALFPIQDAGRGKLNRSSSVGIENSTVSMAIQLKKNCMDRRAYWLNLRCSRSSYSASPEQTELLVMKQRKMVIGLASNARDTILTHEMLILVTLVTSIITIDTGLFSCKPSNS